jgi:hypothetical protein
MRATTALALLGFCAAVALPQAAAFADQKTADNPNGCRVVERKGGAPPGTISSSVTAGGGHVSASTSGGNGVTVYSNNGAGSGVATAGTSGGGTSTMVTTGNGNCTIYVDPGERKADQK